ncbi:aminopeptidase P family protein, partial [Candidatus Bathyarchaeota archaeon]
MDFKRRLTGLQERMEELDVDLAVYGSCQNFQYLTGLLIEWRRGRDLIQPEDNVFIPREGDPVLTLSRDSAEYAEDSWMGDVRVMEEGSSYKELVGAVASDLGWEGGRIGVGDNLWGSTWLEVARSFKGARFRSGKTLMDHLRMIKEPAEIETLRKVARLTDDAMEKIVPGIGEGVTMRELRREIEMAGRSLGASDVSFPSNTGFVRSGSEPNGNVYNYQDDEGLVPGTCIWFDVGFVLDGYCSDWGRSVYLGTPDEEVKKAYEALQRAVVETVDEMHEGSMRVCEIFDSIEASLDRDGYGDYLRARLPHRSVGHQIGVEVHEPPWLKPANRHLL